MGSSINAVINETLFYKRLVTLSSLHSLDRKRIYNIERSTDPSQPFFNPASDLTDIRFRRLRDDHEFRVFLDYLAEVCASTRSGRTVTAVTIHLPKDSNRPEYLLVSNNRFKNDMHRSRRHVEGILKKFGGSQHYLGFPNNKAVPSGTRDEVLRSFLQFNQERFKEYVKIIFNCRNKLSTRSNLNRDSRDLLEALEVVIPWEDIQILRDACDNAPRCNSFVNLAFNFMQELENERNLQEGGIFDSLDILLAGKMQVNRSHYLVLWHELQHALKRMLSLHDAFGVFEATARKWPRLFRGVTVKFLWSKNPKAYRLEKFDHFNAFVQSLELDGRATKKAKSRYGLGREVNNSIQGAVGQKNKRFIHAELQLWAYVRKMFEEKTSVPFLPGRMHESQATKSPAVVIGVSKLTCRLCHWFFQGVNSHRIVIRSSSWNVYHRWALPCLPQDPGIIARLHNELSHELSTVLVGGRVQRTETDTDSAPNSASLYVYSDESSHASSDPNGSDGWSHEGRSTSSVESDPGLGKPGMKQPIYRPD